MADGVPSILAGITREMKHLAERQRVIAQNIAQSETPGYKAREVEALDFAQLLAQQGAGGGTTRIARPQVQITGAMAALGARPTSGGSIVLDHDVAETKPDGNNVTLEDQLLKMGQVQADFTAMTNLYRKQQSLLKTALGRGGGG
ncbi:flagellar biosynthesis protein FlgB [Sphingomonas mollis]|uniref:Flagellar biosynthesis protein FlgB n=1 Tax=Sphingomonas mollis TaxID=2795726 RepID=A0ABS0XQQ8_9SPHN|nr:flagellar biosynthesis protein FlgB [Sphingomonas sp. BT553]MBJ6122073.1 flagellar biosynthesis protein FlgB [Sphingomonas sp. BT553]